MAYTQHTYVFCEEDENGVAHVFDGREDTSICHGNIENFILHYM